MKNKWVFTGLIVLFIFCISWSKSIDFSQDLGRHLKLGQIIFSTRHIPEVNLFSYTYPGFPFTNHHWLAEVCYYLLDKAFGLSSLFVLRSFLLIGTILILLADFLKRNKYIISACSVLIFFPMIMDRLDIRPEQFGYLFYALIFYIILFNRSRKMYTLIPIVMAIWVNMHISFVFGLFLVVIGLLSAWQEKDRYKLSILGLSLITPLLNPHGLNGVVEPFVIFNNYGYPIAENQPLLFLLSATANQVYRYFLLVSPLVFISFCVLVAGKKYSYAVVLATFYVLVFWQVRHLPFFFITAIPLVAVAVENLIVDLKKINISIKAKAPIAVIIAAVYVFAIALIVSNAYYRVHDFRKTFGYGFYDEYNDATKYVLSHNLPGNIFNNFDIGGYLIYRLYPQRRVFVDNRPEAYPAAFFREVYIPLQQDTQLRNETFRKYDIHTVIFSHTDQTGWSKLFIQDILSDPQWRLVFLNTQAMVLTDKTELPELRQNANNFRKIIRETNEPTSLMYFLNFLSVVDATDLFKETMAKIKWLNPYSCMVTKYSFMAESGIPLTQNIAPHTPWWCF